MEHKYSLTAGYYLDSVDRWLRKEISDRDRLDEYIALIKNASSFQLRTNVDLEESVVGSSNSIVNVLHNLIIRGTPTLIPSDTEGEIASRLAFISVREILGSVKYSLDTDQIFGDFLLRALHLVEPRIDRYTEYENQLISWEPHGSKFEESYLYDKLPSLTYNGKGDHLIQLFEPQRSMGSMLEGLKVDPQLASRFKQQNVDFVLEYPYPLNGRRGLVVEIDGSQHEEANQAWLDSQRDQALLKSNWTNTRRIKTSQFDDGQSLEEHFKMLEERLFSHGYYQTIKGNYENPLYNDDEGMSALELMLTPMAIARIQLSVIKAIQAGVLSFEQEEWKIAVIERDVPCAEMALNGLMDFLKTLNNLEGIGKSIPNLILQVYGTSEFESSKLRFIETVLVDHLENDNNEYDLCLDVSMLQRRGLSTIIPPLNYTCLMQIRSEYSQGKVSPFISSKRISWGRLIRSNDDDHYQEIPETVESLRYVLRNIFRKTGFRPGQLPILDRALQNKTVIGLLPTGGGKSLTYQLAGVLQPGHVIVIDPIKSLMKDQVDGLARLGITNTLFINSSLNTKQREQAQTQLKEGKALFCFVSPERLVISSFRDLLKGMAGDNHYFTYGVIDEVHCVSEWGHNFRTPYLSLGKNMIEHCPSFLGEIALFGLTATASFDVLSDVQRELSGNRLSHQIPEEAVIRHETTNRHELQMHVESVNIPEQELQILREVGNGHISPVAVKSILGELKQEKIVELLSNADNILKTYAEEKGKVVTENLIQLTQGNSVKDDADAIFQTILPDSNIWQQKFWNADFTNAGLVFAPHRTWYFGVTDRYTRPERGSGITEKILESNLVFSGEVGTYMGVDSDSEETSAQIQRDNDRNQENYVGNKMSLMVATKAFGMGIDKPNIRITIHNTYPDSIESYVQEAGRAGRDRKLAVSCILFNDQEVVLSEDPKEGLDNDLAMQLDFYNNSFKGEEIEKRTLYELLNEIVFPASDRSQEIERILKEQELYQEKGLQIKIGLPEDFGALFVRNSGTYLGAVNSTTGNFSIAQPATEDSQYILEMVWSVIVDATPDMNADQRKEWLSASTGSLKKPGIEKVLENLKMGGSFEVLIPFTNDHENIYTKISHLLLRVVQLDEQQHFQRFFHAVKSKFSTDLDIFLKNVSQELQVGYELQKFYEDFPQEKKLFRKRLSKFLYSRRDKADTEKAIYRLSIIGVIDDYTVDYNANTYTVYGRKKTDEEYHQDLRYYISKYYSSRRTENIINTLEEREGESEIQRILNFTTDFVYEEVAKKRRESIHAMKECCRVGLREGNIEMKSYIHLYFNSKYARKEYKVEILDEDKDRFRILTSEIKNLGEGYYNCSLQDWSDGKEEEFDWILDFAHVVEFDRSNGEKDNLKHLRGACTRLLTASPDNYVFRLLRAFSETVLEENSLKESTQQNIFEDIKVGFRNLWEATESEEDPRDYLNEYESLLLEKLRNQGTIDWLFELINEMKFLRHVEWTNRFTNSFTQGILQ